jgi:hypothetical protein
MAKIVSDSKYYITFLICVSALSGCLRNNDGTSSNLQEAENVRKIKARFENQQGRFEEILVNAMFTTTKILPSEYGVTRSSVQSDADLQQTLDELSQHLKNQPCAKDESEYQPNQVLVNRFLSQLENYIERKHFGCGKQVILGKPTFRICNEHLNRTGGNIHIDSNNVARDFFKENLVFKGLPPQELPYKVTEMLAFDQGPGNRGNQTPKGSYYNIWFNLFTRDDNNSGLIFGLPPSLGELGNASQFRPFEFRGVTTLKVISGEKWKNMTWLKPSGMGPYDYLIFPTRNTPHGAIDPLISQSGVHRASVEVRFVAFPY